MATQPPRLTPMQQAMALAQAHAQAAADQAAAAAAAAPAAAAPTAAASSTDGSAESAASPTAGAAPPPTKGLLIRVKRKRGDAPLETLVVTSSRAEKRAALDELRTSFEHAAAIHEGDSAAAAQAAVERSASAGAASSAVFAGKAAATAAPSSSGAASGAASSSSPSASPSSGGSGGFILKPPAPQTSTHRIFKLLTTISAPKDQHATDDKIQARIDQMKQQRALLHPALQLTAEQVHQKRLLAQQLSTEEKRELLLQRNRDRAALLNDTPLPKQRALLHNSEEVQVKIVDIQLPGAPAPARTTFQPPPLSQAASAAAAREHQRQLRRSQEAVVEGSSHRSVGSSSSVVTVDPAIAAAEFTRAMASIKRMPQIGRAQMNAYQSLIEDMLASQPPSVAQEVQKMQSSQQKPQESKEQQQAPTPAIATEEEEAPRTQSPRLNRVEPKIPLRRRKKDTAPSAAASSLAASAAAATSVPTHLPLSFVSTPDVALPAGLTSMKPAFTAGGESFDPNQLVPATGFSMHPAPALEEGLHPVGIVTGGDESDEVYDVYAVDEDETGMPSTPALAAATNANDRVDARLPHPHVHGSTTSVPLSSILPGSSSAKVRYDGSSSAYVVLGDGLFQWTGVDDDCTEDDELAAEDEGDVDDDEDKEQSDYGDEEDSSAEEEHEDQIRHVRDDDPEDTPWVDAGGRGPLSQYRSHADLRTVMHDRKTRQQPHGFYPEGPDPDADEEDDDYIVKEVRRTMRGGHPSLSSDDEADFDDDGLCRPHPRLRPDEAQDDQEYTDAIQDEEDMEDERGGDEEDD